MLSLSLILSRYKTSTQGTFGRIKLEDFLYKTLELPWLDNKRQVSCIPAGQYECKIVQSPRFGRVYQVAKVPGRSQILIHWGN